MRPFIEERGGGKDGGKSLLWWDPAKAHMTAEVRAALDELNVHVVMIPASMTYKYQLVDVLIAAIFKRHLAKCWRAWMAFQLLKASANDGVYREKSGNYIQPTIAQCVIWSNKAHEYIKSTLKEQIKRCADKLYMRKEDKAIAPFMPGYYAGKFKCTYNHD